MIHLKKVCFVGFLFILASCNKDKKGLEKSLCTPSGLNNNIIAFYSFSNSLLNDISGNNHHLTNSTSAHSTSDRNGNPDCAYEFDNSPTPSEFLTTSNTTFIDNLDEFSISLWYQPKDTTFDNAEFESLINRGLGFSCPDRYGQWSIGLYDCRKAVFGRTNSVWDNNITGFDCQEEFIMRTDQWVHLVATFNQNGVRMEIYRNSLLQDVSVGNGNCMSGTPNYQDAGDLFLGKEYTGKIDDVIIFNKVLSQQEVNDLYSMESCCEE